MKNFQLPRAGHTIAIILLGALGLMGTITYLTWDLKISAYRSERWIVQNKTAIVDTLRVVIHPQSMVLPARMNKTYKADKIIDYDSLYFTYNTHLLIWMTLLAVTAGSALALIPMIWNAISEIYTAFGQKLKNILRAGLLTLLIGCLMVITSNNHYVLMLFTFIDENHAAVLLRHPHQLSWIVAIGIIAGLLAMCGQLLTNDAIGALPDDLSTETLEKQRKAVNDFALLRNGLKLFLSIDAALIVLSIVTTDTLRRAIVQEVLVTGSNRDGIFPKEFSYMYGMVYTLYLALFYLPIYYRLRTKGIYMVRALTQNEADRELGANFVIKESPLESFKVIFSILAPIASALLPEIIKF